MIQLRKEVQGLLPPMQGLLTVDQQWMDKMGGDASYQSARSPQAT